MRVVLLAAMALVAVNIWTGAPLLALWVGVIGSLLPMRLA